MPCTDCWWGLLVTVIFGMLYFGPSNLRGLLLFALMIAASFMGGLIEQADRN
jgi:hypothetical protein